MKKWQMKVPLKSIPPPSRPLDPTNLGGGGNILSLGGGGCVYTSKDSTLNNNKLGKNIIFGGGGVGWCLFCLREHEMKKLSDFLCSPLKLEPSIAKNTDTVVPL